MLSAVDLPLPLTDGLAWHKPVDEWRRSSGGGSVRRARSKGRLPACECCPYGYHIDLDFVRFCETLAAGSSAGDAASKQRRRERRRQRRSMEVLLGLDPDPIPKQFIHEPLNEGIFEYEEGNMYERHPVRDELQKAVLDFEDTLQRSRNSTLKKKQGDLSN